jgi:hypothetical protein
VNLIAALGLKIFLAWAVFIAINTGAAFAELLVVRMGLHDRNRRKLP